MDDAGRQVQIQPYAQPDEKILWTGRPDPSRVIGRGDAFLIPFSLMWGGGAIAMEGAVVLSGVAKVDRLVNQARSGSA